jgi:hypothetical protein
LLDDCDKRGIIAYDNKGAFVLDSNTGKMEKPKKRTRKHVRVGEENWFIYSDWKRKGS